ncbi:hypothetical protein OR60_16915 [Xanthomonas vesicatoria]|uniref:Uncharacterized protein n=2 Tax=Xanthomonas vesicatoria TaxID=56460 RepID=A0AAJ0IZ80_9XANT|nr:hypothetical protein BI313_22450 [Xanthomonas vesicatoria]KHM92347.1 hypothetical protein OR60_16915 [Xanthomonas vesicatoria]KHM95727.1 hypothetical protein OR61_08210 [Xanthomonas vesicatoria]KTF32408.1 hypothetical protein LMG920_13275 [Xanthomonas vesicatoria]MDG4481795.1 hypothetical protein [Xanthomonas vesicatoria]
MTGRRYSTMHVAVLTAALLSSTVTAGTAAAATVSLAQAQQALDAAIADDKAANTQGQDDDLMSAIFHPRLTALTGCVPAVGAKPETLDCIVTGQAGPSEKHMTLRFVPKDNAWALQHSEKEMEVAAPVPPQARVQVLLREVISQLLAQENDATMRTRIQDAARTAQVAAVERCKLGSEAPVVECNVIVEAEGKRGTRAMAFALVDGQWQNAIDAKD